MGEKKKSREESERLCMHANRDAETLRRLPRECFSPIREVYSLIFNAESPKRPAHVPTLLRGSPSSGARRGSPRYPGDPASLRGAAVVGSQQATAAPMLPIRVSPTFCLPPAPNATKGRGSRSTQHPNPPCQLRGTRAGKHTPKAGVRQKTGSRGHRDGRTELNPSEQSRKGRNTQRGATQEMTKEPGDPKSSQGTGSSPRGFITPAPCRAGSAWALHRHQPTPNLSPGLSQPPASRQQHWDTGD